MNQMDSTKDSNISAIAIARLRALPTTQAEAVTWLEGMLAAEDAALGATVRKAMRTTYPSTLPQAVARIESLMAVKNDAVTAALGRVRRVEDAAERAERYADYRRLMGEAEGVRQALIEISGGQA